MCETELIKEKKRLSSKPERGRQKRSIGVATETFRLQTLCLVASSTLKERYK